MRSEHSSWFWILEASSRGLVPIPHIAPMVSVFSAPAKGKPGKRSWPSIAQTSGMVNRVSAAQSTAQWSAWFSWKTVDWRFVISCYFGLALPGWAWRSAGTLKKEQGDV